MKEDSFTKPKKINSINDLFINGYSIDKLIEDLSKVRNLSVLDSKKKWNLTARHIIVLLDILKTRGKIAKYDGSGKKIVSKVFLEIFQDYFGIIGDIRNLQHKPDYSIKKQSILKYKLEEVILKEVNK